jgi:spermidine/putrescine transport system ATP-binding protein
MIHDIVQLKNVTKKFGSFKALDNISLNVRKGEILTLLGPSGCGKTTLMRIIAGFEDATSGETYISSREVTGVMPEKRNVNMVFQRYALFPHLDVYDNVAFGLRLKKTPADEVDWRVRRMLELVQLSGHASRWIHELSGGQSQRVALARALVNEPDVLLLDEPLAALDLKIRHHMLRELKRIHQETGTTFIYVTHDQDEAMVLSDRVVLMNHGTIEQLAAPEAMYASPETLFCAQFFGETNILPGRVESIDADVASVSAKSGFLIRGAARGSRLGDDVSLSIRPECISLAAGHASGDALGVNAMSGTLQDIAFIGSRVVYRVQGPSGDVMTCQTARPSAGIEFEVGLPVRLGWAEDAVVVLRR